MPLLSIWVSHPELESITEAAASEYLRVSDWVRRTVEIESRRIDRGEGALFTPVRLLTKPSRDTRVSWVVSHEQKKSYKKQAQDEMIPLISFLKRIVSNRVLEIQNSSPPLTNEIE